MPRPVVRPIARSEGWEDRARVPNTNTVVRQESSRLVRVAPNSPRRPALSTQKIP